MDQTSRGHSESGSGGPCPEFAHRGLVRAALLSGRKHMARVGREPDHRGMQRGGRAELLLPGRCLKKQN